MNSPRNTKPKPRPAAPVATLQAVSEEYRRAARGGNDEVGGKCAEENDCRDARRRWSPAAAAACAQLTAPRICANETWKSHSPVCAAFCLSILLLGLRRQPVLPVPQLMRERAMLRDQQQGRQHNLHQAAFQDHQKHACGWDRQQINTTPGDRLQNPARCLSGTWLYTRRHRTVRPRAAMKQFLIFLIKLYQWCLSPFFGGQCRFYPSCSAYAAEAIDTARPAARHVARGPAARRAAIRGIRAASIRCRRVKDEG